MVSELRQPTEAAPHERSYVEVPRVRNTRPALIERVAAEHRLVQRSGGSVQPCELILSLCAASCAGPARSIAEARRQWELLTGQTIARSSFDEHFDKEALGDSILDLLQRMMARSNRALRRQWPGALRELFDVILDDGSRMKLRKAAAEQFPATEANAAGLKLMARMSLGECKLTDAFIGAARTHDHALRPSQPFKAKALYLRDLGFYDHGEFSAICEDCALFVSRWKERVNAIVRGHASGLLLPESLVQEQSLERGDVLGRTSDVDAELNLEDGSKLAVRLVRVRFVLVDKGGKEKGEQERWYVTNLPRNVGCRRDFDCGSPALADRAAVPPDEERAASGPLADDATDRGDGVAWRRAARVRAGRASSTRARARRGDHEGEPRPLRARHRLCLPPDRPIAGRRPHGTRSELRGHRQSRHT